MPKSNTPKHYSGNRGDRRSKRYHDNLVERISYLRRTNPKNWQVKLAKAERILAGWK